MTQALVAADHVRTPEGAAKYGEPIGAVITKDVIARAARAAKAITPGGVGEAARVEVAQQQRPGSRDSILHRIRSFFRGPDTSPEIGQTVDRFSPRTFQSDSQAGQYALNHAMPGRFGPGGSRTTRFKRAPHWSSQDKEVIASDSLVGFHEAQTALREGKPGDEKAKEFIARFKRNSAPTTDDLIVSRRVGLDAFPGGVEGLAGHEIRDDGYFQGNLGTPIGSAPVLLTVAVPKGTRAMFPGNGQSDRGVILDRGQRLHVTKVTPDGKGGFYVAAVIAPEGGSGKPETIREVPHAPEAPQSAAVPEILQPRPAQPGDISSTTPTPAGHPARPAPRSEPVVSQAVGTGGGAPQAPSPERVPTPETPKPEAPRPQAPKPGRALPDETVTKLTRAPQAESAARARQAKIDHARSRAELLTELDELYANKASPTALEHRLKSRARANNVPESEIAPILEAVRSGDEPKVRQLATDLGKREGIELVGHAGQSTKFIRGEHKPIDKPIPDGAAVEVVRPGWTYTTPDGEKITISPVVEASGTSEAGKVPGKPDTPEAVDLATKVSAILTGFQPRQTRGRKAASAYFAERRFPLLPRRQIDAVQRYTEKSLMFNRRLRARLPDDAAEQFKVADLDAAMRPLPDDLLLYRTVDSPLAFGLEEFSDSKMRDLVGTVIRSPAPLSTSLGVPYTEFAPARIVIAAPKGTPSVPAQLHTSNPTEFEILLGRDTDLAITRVERSPIGTWIVHAVALPSDAKATHGGAPEAPKPGRALPDETVAKLNDPKTTVAQMRQIAKDHDIKVPSKITRKADIRDYLLGKEPGVPETGKAKAPESGKLDTPEARDAFKTRWTEAGIQAPAGSPRRELNEVYLGVRGGRLSPEEGVRQLDSGIEIDQHELADIEKTLKRTDLSPADRKELERRATMMRESIDAKTRAAKLLRGEKVGPKKAAPKKAKTPRDPITVKGSPEREALAKKMVRDYTSGKSIQAVATEHGKSSTFVHTMLTEHGVQLRPRGGRTLRPVMAPPRPGTTGPVSRVHVRPELASATDPPSLAKATQSEFKRITGRDLTVDLEPPGVHVSMPTAREHMEGILRSAEAWPDVELDEVRWFAGAPSTPGKPAAWAFTNNRSVMFNSYYLSTEGRHRYLSELAAGVEDWRLGQPSVKPGFHPRGSGHASATGTHEFAHLLDNDEIHPEVADLLRRRSAEAGIPISRMLRRDISGYAAEGAPGKKSNIAEVIAEAFVDVAVNGDKASRLSKEIVELLRGAYRAKHSGKYRKP